MSSHTPGPWKYVVDQRGDQSIQAPSSSPLRSYETLMLDTDYYPFCPENEADWRLIAAAPDLLDALQEVLLWGTNTNYEKADAAVAKARAAIAKAVDGR